MSPDHGIANLCAALDVTRSGYHAWLRASPSEREQRDAALTLKIQAIHARHKGRYGAPRVEEDLRTKGHCHGRKRVARLMKEHGLRPQGPRQFVPQTTDSNHDEPIAPNRLAEEPAPQKPNQIWAGAAGSSAGAPERAWKPAWSSRPCRWHCDIVGLRLAYCTTVIGASNTPVPSIAPL